MKDSRHTKDLIKRAALDLGTKTGGVPTTFNFSVFKRNISDESELIRNIATVIEATFPGMGNPYLWAPAQYDVVIKTQDKMGEYDATLFTEQALNRACGELGLKRQEKTPDRDSGILEILNHFKTTGFTSGRISRINGILRKSSRYMFWDDNCSCQSVIETMVEAGILGLDNNDYGASEIAYLTELGREVLKLYGDSMTDLTVITDLIKSVAFFKLKRYWAEAVAHQIIEDSDGPLLYSVEKRLLERKPRKDNLAPMQKIETPKYEYSKPVDRPKAQEIEIKHSELNPPKLELKPQTRATMPIKIEQPIEIVKPKPVETIKIQEVFEAPKPTKENIIIKNPDDVRHLEVNTAYPSIFEMEDIQDVVLKLTMLQLKCESKGQPGKADTISNMIKFLMKG